MESLKRFFASASCGCTKKNKSTRKNNSIRAKRRKNYRGGYKSTSNNHSSNKHSSNKHSNNRKHRSNKRPSLSGSLNIKRKIK